MKVLLDKCVPQPFCRHRGEHECHGARRAGYRGKQNGELLALAVEAGLDVLITVDKDIPYQQNMAARLIALLIIGISSNKLTDLVPHAPASLLVLSTIRPGQVVRVK